MNAVPLSIPATSGFEIKARNRGCDQAHKETRHTAPT
jgi:hypothetical protein